MHRFLNIQQNIKLRNYHQLLLYFVAAAGGRAEVRRGRRTGTGKRSLRKGSRKGSRAAAAVKVTVKVTFRATSRVVEA